MPIRPPRARPPVALIVDGQEWSYRSLESVLMPAGYAVMRANSEMQGVKRARAHPPDVLFAALNLPDGSGIGLCHTLQEDLRFGADIPIIVMGRGVPTKEQRLAALEAGAWEFLTYPFDGDELLLKLEAYTGAKFEVDRIREQSLIDHLTGLYSTRGLERRAQEMRAQAYRNEQPLACVVIAPSFESDGESPGAGTDVETVEAAVTHLAKTLRDIARISDVVGRLGRTEFAVLAPATDANGAIRMAERLAEAVLSSRGTGGDGPKFKLRAGFDAVANLRESPIEGQDLLERAAIALRRARGAENDEWIQAFDMAWSGVH